MSKISFIPCRLQCSLPHKGHYQLVNKVIDLSDKVYILLGTSVAKNTRRNPLDYETRKLMVLSDFPGVKVLPIKDYKSDEYWSEEIDKLIQSVTSEDDEIKLYGSSKDSFKPHYFGKYEAIELDDIVVEGLHAKDERAEIAKQPIDSVDFRKGVIYSVYNKWDTIFPTVDIAILDDHNKVLLGRKPAEKLFRFIGGFVDGNDPSLEYAAHRECLEEIGKVELSPPIYLCSCKVNDWRYPDTDSTIMTNFFVCKYIYGHTVASDDIEELAWFDIDSLTEDMVVGEHGRTLLPKLKEYVHYQNNKTYYDNIDL